MWIVGSYPVRCNATHVEVWIGLRPNVLVPPPLLRERFRLAAVLFTSRRDAAWCPVKG
jgi:hypothetical protein